MENLSLYGYLLGFRGLCRFNLPDFDRKSDCDDTPPEFKIEPVFYLDLYKGFPMDMGLFSSGHNVYMVGGKDEEDPEITPMHNLYVFDPTRHEEEGFPVKDLSFLDKPLDCGFKSLVSPIVLQPNNHHLIYFLTRYCSPWNNNYNYRRMCFQSFDPIKNTFRTLPSPPYTHDTTRMDLNFREVGCFAAGEYIYLFTQDHMFSCASFHSNCEFTRAFSFNTILSEWKEMEGMVTAFREENIPIPFFHQGHAGLSHEFPGKTRIMVATCGSTPIAYRVTLDANGSFRPKSYRYLLENYNLIPKNGVMSQLHDIGSGRFLVFFQSDSIPLMLYVFQIDYEREFQIQNFGVSPESSQLLCLTKFLDKIPLFGHPTFYAYCLASAPASQSSGNQTAAAEEQDRDCKMDKGIDLFPQKRKRNSNRVEGKRNSQEAPRSLLLRDTSNIRSCSP